MAFPTFSPGDVLNASDMNAVGLWLVKSDTIASGSSTHIVTGAFSASYDNYLIFITSIQVAAGAPNMLLQLRTGGTTANSNYFWGGTNSNYTNRTDENSGSTSSWKIGIGVAAANQQHHAIQLFAPFAATATTMYSHSAGSTSTHQIGGIHTTTTSYDEFVISPASSTLSAGTIKVYGYKP